MSVRFLGVFASFVGCLRTLASWASLRAAQRTGLRKKAQFYIFIGILLLTYAFAIATPSVLPRPATSPFEELYLNFLSETPVVINNALYEGANVSARYKAFSDEYFAYARTRDPAFSFVYLLRDGDTLLVGNHQAVGINITASGTPHTLPPFSILHLAKAAAADVIINEFTYSFAFTGQDVEVKAVFRKEDVKEVRVHVAE